MDIDSITKTHTPKTNNNNKMIDYIHIRNIIMTQKAKSMSQKWKSSTIVNTLTKNTIQDFKDFYQCKYESFTLNTLSLRFCIQNNKIIKTKNYIQWVLKRYMHITKQKEIALIGI